MRNRASSPKWSTATSRPKACCGQVVQGSVEKELNRGPSRFKARTIPPPIRRTPPRRRYASVPEQGRWGRRLSRRDRQRGGRNSLASQPMASVFMGSTATETFSMRSQVEHSNVRSSNPRVPGEIRAKAIVCLHTGHIGRSLIKLPITVPQDHRQNRTCSPYLTSTGRRFQAPSRSQGTAGAGAG
jgi:hypothetical protein